ncbi:hypothetical protein MAPG_06077 [Magnaporthiopsis poae ATCC 64411]|uniref:Uncharacterized protein n=1 Tax=Magnaporthiopsis poae (strain ATCC 64411 / 73-15) TaxID=644358 RepID=A0A0C4E133_MAGP6|nr:hypothetical protein MAPG_06077 [Magnaporthiopsis poae ATCC 64411]
MSPVLAFTSKLSDVEPGASGERIWGWLTITWERLNEWIHQLPTWVWWAVIAWAVTFTLVSLILLSVGFGPLGVVFGSVAAMFQSWAYGAFTPAGSLFAICTSMAMLGTLNPAIAVVAAVIATVVAVIVGVSGAGR